MSRDEWLPEYARGPAQLHAVGTYGEGADQGLAREVLAGFAALAASFTVLASSRRSFVTSPEGSFRTNSIM